MCACRGRVNVLVMGGVEEKRRMGGTGRVRRGRMRLQCPMRDGCPTLQYMPTCRNTHLHTQESETVFQEQWEQTIKYIRDHIQSIQRVWSYFYHLEGVYFVIMNG